MGWAFFVLRKFKTLKLMMLLVVQGVWHLEMQFRCDLVQCLKDYKIESAFYYLFDAL